MKTTHLTFIALAGFGALTMGAQTNSTDQNGVYIPPPPSQAPASQSEAAQPPGAPPPPPAVSMPLYNPYNPYHAGTGFAGAISFPYAFAWNAAGVSAELGGLFNGHNFLGGEVSYYGSDYNRYDVYGAGNAYLGSFRSQQQVTTVDFAYRYFAPLWRDGPYVPVGFYVGASGGAGFVNFSNSGSYFGFHNDNNPVWNGEVVAGVEFNDGPAALRIGYRYVELSNAWQFDRRSNLDSNVLEIGISLKL